MALLTRRSFLQAAGVAAGSFGLKWARAADSAFQPNWASLVEGYRAPDWFRDAKFGIWAHWSAQCVPEVGDWPKGARGAPARRGLPARLPSH